MLSEQLKVYPVTHLYWGNVQEPELNTETTRTSTTKLHMFVFLYRGLVLK